MKFAKELDQELVPEWRAKYLDYKTGKKKLKAIARALHKANRSSSFPSLPHDATPSHGNDPTPRSHPSSTPYQAAKEWEATDPAYNPASTPARSSGRISTPGRRTERQPLRIPGSRFSAIPGTYGSILATPQQHVPSSDVASFELPDPAIDPAVDSHDHQLSPKEHGPHRASPRIPSPSVSRHGSTRTVPAETSGPSSSLRRTATNPTERGNPGQSATRASQLLKRVFTHPDGESSEKRAQAGGSMSEYERRQDEFMAFLDSELGKIESFYQLKEEESTARLAVLRKQLHIMRDQRTQEVLGTAQAQPQGDDKPQPTGFGHLGGQRIKGAFTGRRIGKNSKALAGLDTPAAFPPQDAEGVMNRSDFNRRVPAESPNAEVSYRSAKRKLKHALQEYYRGVELLKGYAYLNRTAFRKINKKYDKVVNARPTMRYMSEKVNKAWFVQSEVTENLLTATEDLYARYFERGNRKIAASKLRRSVKKTSDFSPNTFRSGLLLMAGVLFGIQGLIYAGQHLNHSDDTINMHTSYLLQIYGGYFLIVFHFLLFCLDCMVWTKSKINYVFIFEYDARYALDWRQLTELPAFFMFLLGLIMWLNFLSHNDCYIYWPVILVGLTVCILFLPARVLYHRSRKWWAYSNWRLLLAGFYPVEFRDFFLGDMYCSQTYAMGNIELFFCLYAHHWTDSLQCNSSQSRLLGFFTTVPSILRALQCLRRYADTRNIFPHLLNFGKYMFGVLYYATMSMYRIDRVSRFEAPFITFALLNAVYVSVWDLAMDWSLGNPYAKHPLLREALAFRRVWVYYAAMALDVVVRFNWIFYAIFAHDVQHSAVLSFVVSFSEVCRRGIWTIFRVENEHCSNVLLFRASRDIPLPYKIPSAHAPPHFLSGDMQLEEQPPAVVVSPADPEQGAPPTPGASMRARNISRVGSLITYAHTQDFQRRKPASAASPAVAAGVEAAETPEDTSDEEDDASVVSGAYIDTDRAIAEELPFRDAEVG